MTYGLLQLFVILLIHRSPDERSMTIFPGRTLQSSLLNDPTVVNKFTLGK